MTLSDDDKRRLYALERDGVIPVLRGMARSYAAPFFWYEDGAVAGDHILNNGTASFASTGESLLMLTCDHVYAGWLAARTNNSRLVCQVGAAIFDPTEVLVDRDASLDLATFRISEVLLNAIGTVAFSPMVWPPGPVLDSDIVMAGGFPGAGIWRHNVGAGPIAETLFLFPTYTRRIDSVRVDNLGLRLTTEEAYSTQGLIPTANPDLGGASGGPIFRVRDRDLVPLELVGIIYEYQQSWELLFARPVTLIQADGTLVR
jgi:hypothetical protein